MGEVVGNDAAAEFAGVSASTWRSYVSRHQAPAPDRREIVGGHAVPVWSEATLDSWLTNRPGRGVGGGRKPRASERLTPIVAGAGDTQRHDDAPQSAGRRRRR